MRILVAEDSPENREVLVELLRNGGHTVTGVSNGHEALDALEKERFEIVFLDEEMPSMGGIEAACAIHRKGVSLGRRPIIVGISGHATETDERRCLNAGMDAFLPKPIGMAELLGLLAVLSRRPSQIKFASAQNGHTPRDLAARLQRATGGKQKLLRSLIKNFLADAPRKLSTVWRAVRLRDAAGLASAAHAFTGSLGLFGADQAVAAARRLQSIGRSGNVEGAEAEFRTLKAEFMRLRRELLALRAGPEPKRNSKLAKPRARRTARHLPKRRS